MHVIGLMSGTSMDGVDGVLAAFDDTGDTGQPMRCLAHASADLPAPLRAELFALQASGPDELVRAALAANALADVYTEVVHRLMTGTGIRTDDVAAIGAHGQTVRHRPDLGFTLQINAPSRLAERTGIPVIADFRGRDVAAGGQGAPLVPAFHADAFGHATERRVVVNVGGMANLSVLPARDEQEAVITGWDCGPGNVLLDGWCQRHLGTRFDRDGAWAASGRPVPDLLHGMLAEPFFAAAPPKSTGRDLFDAAWLARHLQTLPRTPTPADVQATLLELTATTIAQACRPRSPARVLVCGGGARNPVLVSRLRALLTPAFVQTTDEIGVPAMTVEALAFAWLAHRHLQGRPGNLPTVTGAVGPRILGALYPR